MSEKYSPKVGDRVRVVLEGEVHHTGGDTPSDFTIGLNLINGNSKWVVSVEKIEPPVEVFKPGDVLRGLGLRDLYVAVTTDGWVRLGSGTHYRDPGYDFTSKHYERVNLS